MHYFNNAREALIKSTCADWRADFSSGKPKSRRNTDVFQGFLAQSRRKRCRQDVRGDLFSASLDKAIASIIVNLGLLRHLFEITYGRVIPIGINKSTFATDVFQRSEFLFAVNKAYKGIKEASRELVLRLINVVHSIRATVTNAAMLLIQHHIIGRLFWSNRASIIQPITTYAPPKRHDDRTMSIYDFNVQLT